VQVPPSQEKTAVGSYGLIRDVEAGSLTLNQRVQGSNPCTPTSEFRRLVRLSPDAASQKSRLGSTWEARGGDRAERAVTPDGGIHRFGSAGRWLGGEPRGRRPLARQPTTGQQRRQAKRELPGTASMMRAAEPSAART